jgi:hypothetical protein
MNTDTHSVRYEVCPVGSFWEVFDVVEKITVFVSESFVEAKEKANSLNVKIHLD